MIAMCVVIVVMVVTATLVYIELDEMAAWWMYSRRRPMGMTIL